MRCPLLELSQERCFGEMGPIQASACAATSSKHINTHPQTIARVMFSSSAQLRHVRLESGFRPCSLSPVGCECYSLSAHWHPWWGISGVEPAQLCIRSPCLPVQPHHLVALAQLAFPPLQEQFGLKNTNNGYAEMVAGGAFHLLNCKFLCKQGYW